MVIYQGKKERVRLLGIDTPERGEPGFQDAKDALKARLEGHPIALEWGEARDCYRRLLASVHVDGAGP